MASFVVVELVVGAYLMPVSILGADSFRLGSGMCDAQSFIYYWICALTLFHMTILAVDRYLAVCHPLVYRLFTTYHAFIAEVRFFLKRKRLHTYNVKKSSVDLDTIDKTEDIDTVDKTEDLDNVGKTDDIDTVDKTEDLDTVGKTEDLDTVDKTEDLDTVDKTENLDTEDKTDLDDTVDKTEDLDTVDKTEDLDTVDKTEDLDTVDKTEDLDTIDKTEDPETVDKTENLDTVDKTEDLDTVDKTEDLDTVDKTEDLDTVDKTEDLDTIDKTDDLDTVDKTEDLDTVNKMEQTGNNLPTSLGLKTKKLSQGEASQKLNETDCLPSMSSGLDISTYAVIYVLISSIIMFAVISNLIIFVAMVRSIYLTTVKNRSFSSITKVQMASFVVVELIVGAYLMPVSMVGADSFRLGYNMCIAQSFLGFWICALTLFHMTILALDRYLAVCHPLVYRLFTTYHAFIAVALTWIILFILCATVALVKTFLKQISFYFTLFFYFVVYLVPILGAIILYALILREVRCFLRRKSLYTYNVKRSSVKSMREGLDTLDKTEDIDIVDKTEYLDTVDKTEYLDTVDKTEDIDIVDKTEDIDIVDKTEDLDTVDKTEDLDTVDKTEDLDTVDKTEDLDTVDKREDLDTVDKTEDLDTVDKTEDLDTVDKTEHLDTVDKTEHLDTVDKRHVHHSSRLYYRRNTEPIISKRAHLKAFRYVGGIIFLSFAWWLPMLITSQ
uniref:G-protein coupled receptors family 1 profile domain-containing protein n=1 Tax=Biomphalaria glabrata TaxID=6526 RepID=A0A2C9M670_BIOGL